MKRRTVSLKKIAITSLGCPRNLVDSEVLAGHLREDGFEVSGMESAADTVIINTCSFIQSAREESIDAIIEASELKKSGKIKRLIISGCLAQMFKSNLLGELPEADAVIGTGDIESIRDVMHDLERPAGRGRVSRVSDRPNYLYDAATPRMRLTPGHYAYVKISEGCSNHCSYCAISHLRGALRSRNIESIVEEVKDISSGGLVKEINLIGQDTTLFGRDVYGKESLARLLKEITRLKGCPEWIRVLYTHPAHYTEELIDTIASEEKICKYLDLPIQHASDAVLKRMNRQTTKKEIEHLIAKLRSSIPGLALRTSVIVGFPGETDVDFRELLDFIRLTKFERLGAFTYSREELTPAYNMDRQIPEEVKDERLDELMKLQKAISEETSKRCLGRTVDVLIEERVVGEKGKYAGRSEQDAPEIDGVVHVTGDSLKVGEFCKVKILDALEYDLAGEAI